MNELFINDDSGFSSESDFKSWCTQIYSWIHRPVDSEKHVTAVHKFVACKYNLSLRHRKFSIWTPKTCSKCPIVSAIKSKDSTESAFPLQIWSFTSRTETYCLFDNKWSRTKELCGKAAHSLIPPLLRPWVPLQSCPAVLCVRQFVSIILHVTTRHRTSPAAINCRRLQRIV